MLHCRKNFWHVEFPFLHLFPQLHTQLPDFQVNQNTERIIAYQTLTLYQNSRMSRPLLLIVLCLLVRFTCFSAFAAGNIPLPIDSVNFKRIQHKKVRKLITQQKHFGIRTFNEIHPVCYNIPDSSTYRSFTKSELISQDINIVWNNLIHQSPSDEFNGRIVTFGLLYSKKSNDLLYSSESYAGIEEGQILFFNLRVLSGIKNLAVAMEVTRLDNNEKTIEYCYVDHGETKGTQKFTLKSTPDGFTEITQLTKYKCKSRLRDRRLYSFFHERIVKEFFNAIKRKSESGNLVIVGMK
jgi:hypothetical protein